MESALRGELLVDRDTQHVPGSPPIFDTILDKIQKAVIFVPDLTFVGTRANGKPVPNPNVLLEYGYALNQHGHRRIIAVMNSAYGEPTQENMPFNLGHRRFPIRYTLHEDATDETRKTVRDSLSKELDAAIRLIFDSEEYKASLPVVKRPRTALDEAEDYADEVEYEAALKCLESGEGLKKVRDNVRKLFAEIESKCAQINNRGRMQIEVGSRFVEGEVDQLCTMKSAGFSTLILLRQPFFGTSRDASLSVREYRGRLMLPNDLSPRVYSIDPEVLNTTTYLPHLSPYSDIGWAKETENMKEVEFISTSNLADTCMREFIQLMRGGTV